MNGYFKPLRRKIGIVTLLLACIIMAVWVRSLIMHDQFTMIDNNEFGPAWLLSSRKGCVYVQTTGHTFGRMAFWQSAPSPPLMPACGVPYWPFATSLTLLSAYLFVSKSRSKPAAT